MRNFLQTLFTLLVIGAMAWVAWQGYLLIAEKGATLDAFTRALLVVAGAVVLICTFMLGSAIRSVGHERSRQGLIQRRVELYEAFVLLWQATIQEVEEQQATHLGLDAPELKSSLSLYASTEVLQAINQLLEQAATKGIASCEDAFTDVLMQMRKDIGNSNDYPIRTELAKLFTETPKNALV